MNLSELKIFCENSQLICHNAKFEYKWLLNRQINPNIIDDTALLAYLYDERLPLDLDSLCIKFDVDKSFKEEYGIDVCNIEGERLQKRNTKDARNTKVLRDKLKPLLTEKELKVYTQVLLPAARSLALIENQGICIDRQEIEKLQVELDNKILELNIQADPFIKQFEQISGKSFNIDSHLQRGILVYDFLGYSPLPFNQAKTEGGDPSTQAKVLKRLFAIKETPTLDKIIKYTSYSGWKEYYTSLLKYCDKCNKTHWDTINGKDLIFTSLRLGETTTGRIKSDHPNMQNIPGREGGWTRKVFKSKYPNGILLECDYDQIELKLLAGLSQDDKLIHDFLDNMDLHVEMAKLAFNILNLTKSDTKYRDLGKTLNYAIPFGRGAAGIAFDTGRTLNEAYLWLKRYWKQHPQLKKWLNSIPQNGIVISPTGMKRHCETWTQGKNFPIQNSALIALLVAINRIVDKAIIWNCPIDLCIHDSLRFDVEDASKLNILIPKIRKLVEFGPGELYSWLPIPLTVSFKAGKNWGEMKKIA